MKKLLTAVTLGIAAMSAAHAQDGLKPRWLLGVGVAGGGDTLAHVTFTDGSSQNVTAGGGGTIYAGAEFRTSDVVSFQTTLGYHFRTTAAASNGDVTFSRWPLDLLGFYQVNDKFRLGGGAQIELSPKLKGSGVASNIQEDFSTATGAVLEGEYLFTPAIGMKVRYVAVKFKPSSGGQSANGNHAGLMFNFYF